WGVAKDRAIRHLPGGQVDLRFGLPLETAHPYVADHANHDAIVERKREVSSERGRGVLVRPEPSDERFADDGYIRLAIERVRFADVTPALQRDAEGREVAWRH